MKKGFLRNAFMTVAAVSVMAGASPIFPAQEAEATTTTTAVIITSSAAANSVAANAAANARADREAMNNLIVNPSDNNIVKAYERSLINSYQLPYVAESVKAMALPQGISADDITEDQRDMFKAVLKQKQNAAIVSSATAEGAINKGLPRPLSKYFTECKSRNNGVNGTMECMSDEHWEKETKPLLQVMGAAAGTGFLIVVGGGAIMNRRRKNQGGFGCY